MKKQNKRVGSSLDDFLQEEGMLEGARTIAIKEAIAWQVQEAMVREPHQGRDGEAYAHQPRRARSIA